MNKAKPDLQEMRRLLYGHQWSELAEWGQAVRALADLSDEQIDLITTPDRDAAATPAGSSPDGGEAAGALDEAAIVA